MNRFVYFCFGAGKAGTVDRLKPPASGSYRVLKVCAVPTQTEGFSSGTRCAGRCCLGRRPVQHRLRWNKQKLLQPVCRAAGCFRLLRLPAFSPDTLLQRLPSPAPEQEGGHTIDKLKSAVQPDASARTIEDRPYIDCHSREKPLPYGSPTTALQLL